MVGHVALWEESHDIKTLLGVTHYRSPNGRKGMVDIHIAIRAGPSHFQLSRRQRPQLRFYPAGGEYDLPGSDADRLVFYFFGGVLLTIVVEEDAFAVGLGLDVDGALPDSVE